MRIEGKNVLLIPSLLCFFTNNKEPKKINYPT